MQLNTEILKNEERVIYSLRELYRGYGYSQFKMGKFEEYDFYARNKDFLVSEDIITFTDTNGKLMALKPDVTLSIVRSSRGGRDSLRKVYYNENVYRVSNRTRSFREIMQTGLECIGNVDCACVDEVVTLAAKSLKRISDDSVLVISHLDVVEDALKKADIADSDRKRAMQCLREKNLHELRNLCAGGFDALEDLVSTYGAPDDVLAKLRAKGLADGKALAELESVVRALDAEGLAGMVSIDFSLINDMSYYNGITFKGFISGIPDGVLSGGQYDRLMKKLGKDAGAIGFAVYIDTLERLPQIGEEESAAGAAESPAKTAGAGASRRTINIALPKGRLGEQVYDKLEKAGFGCPEIREEGRKLIFENKELGIRYFWAKPSDVAIYVERGAADIGIAGKDILLEYEPDVYELLDLDLGKCRMAVAAMKTFRDDPSRTLRVATKFENIARRYYASIGRDIDIIHLNGSIEIAPILDLSDVIVDIVETGTTLKENDLEVVETIVPISARLIANKSSFEFMKPEIERVMRGLAE